jgi:peptidoglycan/LPS O-acetylase OafA/YrhL
MNSRLQRFYVLDAIRIVLALVVAIGHAGMMPLFGSIDQPNALLALLARGLRTFAFGPPAVIAFFLISGFCIHYPFAVVKTPCPFLRFYMRRYIRILIPVICTVALFKVFFPNTVIIGTGSILWASTLWSIVCEEIYYALYPILNRGFLIFNWTIILGIAFAISILVVWYHFPATGWEDIGIVATTLTLFPVWLLGCRLAEQVGSLKIEYSTGGIWLWRFGAWVTMWAALVLHFHTNLHQTFSGVFIGVIYYFWIRAEIVYYKDRAPRRWLVWGGNWSYSLYLIHPIAIQLLLGYYSSVFQSSVGWLLGVTAILLTSYVFYLLVERPSHNLARRVTLMVSSRDRHRPAAETVGL